MRQRIALLTALVVLVGASRVWAQLYAPETIAQDFRVEWQAGQNRKGPTVEGYGTTTAVVLGTVPLDGRAYFSGPVPPAASYRVQPVSWDWTGGGAVGSGGM